MKKNPHLLKIYQLTTEAGIYQHGRLDIPNPNQGYALEDQARALLVAKEYKDSQLEKIYLDHIIRAKRSDSLLYQYSFDDQGFIDNSDPEPTIKAQEAYGITIWGLIGSKNYPGKNSLIDEIVNRLLKNSGSWTSPRAIATALLGLSELPENFGPESEFIEKLIYYYSESAVSSWSWFENYLTYANAILPWSFWANYLKSKNKRVLKIAQESTRFLIKTCQENGFPAPVGSNGWYFKGGEKTLYDQQTIDAAYMVCCLEKAYLVTQNSDYLKWAEKWWGWFWGNNLQKVAVARDDFSCYDGLAPWGPNRNLGGEANVCFLLAYSSAKRLRLLKPNDIMKPSLNHESPKNRGK